MNNQKSSYLFWVVLATAFTALGGVWNVEMPLGGGEFWERRVTFAVTNSSSEAWNCRTLGVRIARDGLPLAGCRVEELRLADARGTLLEYGVWTPDGNVLLRRGPIPEGSVLGVPVVCAAGARAVFAVYYGNRRAQALADFWTRCPDGPVQAEIGEEERLDVAVEGSDSPPPQGDWLYRVPVRVANFSDEPTGEVLAGFSLREALHAAANARYGLFFKGVSVPVCAVGDTLLFRASVPPGTVHVYHFCVAPGDRGKNVSRPVGPAASSLASEIPSDQIVCEASVGDEKEFRRLVESPVNLLENAGFEDGFAGWRTTPEKDTAARYRIGEESARFGRRSAEMHVPLDAPTDWRGWCQVVSVKPGRRYLYGAFVKGKALTSDVRVHLHLMDSTGRVIRGGMPSTGLSVSADSPWTALYSVADSASAVKVNFLMTMNSRGTACHDGALLAECVPALMGRREHFRRAHERGFSAQAVDTLVKVFPETPVAGKEAGFSLALARGETESLQVAVRSDRCIRDLEAKVELPLAVEVGRVVYVPVDAPSAYYSCSTPEWELRYPKAAGQSDGWSGMWPDPIVPQSRWTLPADETHAFRFSVTLPRTARPGVYAGRIVWTSSGREIASNALSVKVWDFTLPEHPTFPAVFDVRLDGKTMPAWNRLGGTDFEKRDKIWALMAAYKTCPDDVGVHLPFTRGEDGKVRCDFTEYDRRMERFFGHYRFPTAYMPLNFYAFGWGQPPKKFLGESPYEGESPYKGVDRGRLRSGYVKAYQEALRLYLAHVKEKGWSGRLVLYLSDEPYHWNEDIRRQMKALGAMIYAVDPSVRIYVSTWQHVPEWNDTVTVWGAGAYGSFPPAEISRRRAAGQDVRWTTDGQMCLDTPYLAIERLLPHFARRYGVSAFEFWAATWITYDPWERGTHAYVQQSGTPGVSSYVRYPAGDGYLLYPPRDGTGGRPVPTIRLEAVRDGVEDYEYLVLLEKLAGTDAEAAELLEELRALVPIPNVGGRHSTRLLPEPERLDRLRMRAGELLSRRRGS